MTCAEAAACVGRLPVVVVSTRRRGCLRSLMMSHNLSHEKRGHPTLEIFFSFVDMNAFATNHVPVFFVHIVNV